MSGYRRLGIGLTLLASTLATSGLPAQAAACPPAVTVSGKATTLRGPDDTSEASVGHKAEIGPGTSANPTIFSSNGFRVWRSTDGGCTWQMVYTVWGDAEAARPVLELGIGSFGFENGLSNFAGLPLIVGVLAGKTAGSRVVYLHGRHAPTPRSLPWLARSVDGGVTFETVGTLPRTPEVTPSDYPENGATLDYHSPVFTMAPSDPSVLYLKWGPTIFGSTDSGRTWSVRRTIKNAMPSSLAVTVSPTNPQEIVIEGDLVVGRTDPDLLNYGKFSWKTKFVAMRSVDGGVTVTELSKIADVVALEPGASRSAPAIIWAWGEAVGGARAPLMRSTDGGRTFRRAGIPSHFQFAGRNNGSNTRIFAHQAGGLYAMTERGLLYVAKPVSRVEHRFVDAGTVAGVRLPGDAFRTYTPLDVPVGVRQIWVTARSGGRRPVFGYVPK